MTNVEYTSDDVLLRKRRTEGHMNPKYEGLIVDGVAVGRSGKSFVIEWAAPQLGFGEITVVLGDDGKLHVYTECMSDEFVALALSKMVEHMVREE